PLSNCSTQSPAMVAPPGHGFAPAFDSERRNRFRKSSGCAAVGLQVTQQVQGGEAKTGRQAAVQLQQFLLVGGQRGGRRGTGFGWRKPRAAAAGGQPLEADAKQRRELFETLAARRRAAGGFPLAARAAG